MLQRSNSREGRQKTKVSRLADRQVGILTLLSLLKAEDNLVTVVIVTHSGRQPQPGSHGNKVTWSLATGEGSFLEFSIHPHSYLNVYNKQNNTVVSIHQPYGDLNVYNKQYNTLASIHQPYGDLNVRNKQCNTLMSIHQPYRTHTLTHTHLHTRARAHAHTHICTHNHSHGSAILK